MACIQFPRKERGGVSLGSYDIPTIYKDPPKEIFTQKKERVEEGDITYNIRNDSSRYSDAISNYAKAQNQMVSVDYQNRKNQTTTMNFGSASNPYKVNQAFRPPMFREVDLQPLSRQRREYVGARSNLGSDLTRDDFFDFNRMDQHEISFASGAQHVYHAEQSNVSREQGIYHDNFQRKDVINEQYTTQNVLSQLKGMESVELQKLFQYENTPHGIVITPLSIESVVNVSGIKDYEAQRVGNNEQRHILNDTMQFEQESGVVGQKNYEAQRVGNNEQRHILNDTIQFSQGSGVVGQKDYEAHRIGHNEQRHILNDTMQFGQGSGVVGQKDYEAHRIGHNEQRHIQHDTMQFGQGSGVVGQKDYEAHRSGHNEQRNLRKEEDILRYAQGTNVKGMSKQEYLEVQKEKMKDVLLKNMKSTVHIVIQTSGGRDQYQIQANVKDKIDLIVNSAKGQAVSLRRENGEPVKVKDYTWKFVKSATGADTFIIQADLPEVELDRKAVLYAAQSAPSHNIHVPIMNNVDLKTERINVSASTNSYAPENSLNAGRVSSEVVVRKEEKETNYTDMMIQTVRPTMDRVDISNVKLGNKQRIQQSALRELDGRFD